MTNHINQIKEVLMACLEAELKPIGAIQLVGERCRVFLESLDTNKDVNAIMEADRTGIRPVRTFYLKDFPGLESETSFGVPLEIVVTRSKIRVPSLVTRCVAYLNDLLPTGKENEQDQLNLWISSGSGVNLEAVHPLRTFLNLNPNPSRKSLMNFTPEVIGMIIQLYIRYRQQLN